MREVLSIFLFLLPYVLSGPNDTLEQLRVAFSNVPLADQVLGADVTTEFGEAPEWIDGSFVRHACGAYGETGSDSDMVNYVSHVFDCIPMGQSYSFHEGRVTFSHQFYESNMVEIWEKYDEDMNQSSVWWGCIYAKENRTAMDRESDDLYKPGKPSVVPAVAWWKVGKDVLAMTEYPSGPRIDVHHNKYLGDYPYENGDWTRGFRSFHSPAHEQYDETGRVWSSAGVQKQEGGSILLSRIVFTLDPETHKREVVGEFPYADIDLSKCTGVGEVYPDPEGRYRNIHSFQLTENFVIIPETSYMHDPCTWIFEDESKTGWNGEYHFESSVNSRILVMEKSTGTFVASVDIPPMMVTHTLGAYEDADSGLLHYDVLKYNDSSPYTKWTFVDPPLNGEEHPENAVQATRYSLNMNQWSLNETKNLIQTPWTKSLEFSNINFDYQGKPYKYAYMSTNMYNLHGTLVKLNVDDGTVIEADFPNGLFPTEPIFVSRPYPEAEDDGVVLMSGIDGGREKGFIMVFNATNLELIYHATAPKLTLFGVHSKFFHFDVGCEAEDCTPL